MSPHLYSDYPAASSVSMIQLLFRLALRIELLTLESSASISVRSTPVHWPAASVAFQLLSTTTAAFLNLTLVCKKADRRLGAVMKGLCVMFDKEETYDL